MLKLAQGLIWAFERLMEMILMSWFIMVFLVTEKKAGFGLLLINVVDGLRYLATVFIMTGYLFTTAWFSIVRDRAAIKIHCGVVFLLFSAHLVVVPLGAQTSLAWKVYACGLISVLISSLVGSIAYRLVKKSIKESGVE